MNAFARQQLRDRGGKQEQSDEAIQREVKKISESKGLQTDSGTNRTGVYELMGKLVAKHSLSLRIEQSRQASSVTKGLRLIPVSPSSLNKEVV